MTEKLNRDKEQLETSKKKSFIQILKKNFRKEIRYGLNRIARGALVCVIIFLCALIYEYFKTKRG